MYHTKHVKLAYEPSNLSKNWKYLISKFLFEPLNNNFTRSGHPSTYVPKFPDSKRQIIENASQKETKMYANTTRDVLCKPGSLQTTIIGNQFWRRYLKRWPICSLEYPYGRVTNSKTIQLKQNFWAYEKFRWTCRKSFWARFAGDSVWHSTHLAECFNHFQPGNIATSDNKDRNACESKNGTECLSNKILKLRMPLTATNTKLFHDILVQEKNNVEFFFTSYPVSFQYQWYKPGQIEPKEPSTRGNIMPIAQIYWNLCEAVFWKSILWICMWNKMPRVFFFFLCWLHKSPTLPRPKTC